MGCFSSNFDDLDDFEDDLQPAIPSLNQGLNLEKMVKNVYKTEIQSSSKLQIHQYQPEIVFEEEEEENSNTDSIEFEYELNYFNLYHKGEYIRIALELAGVNWKDNIILQSEWPTYKFMTPNGYLPTLKEYGKRVPKDQALALLRYICHKHGMYPENPMDRYKAERIVDIITSDCQFATDEFFQIKDVAKQELWCQKRTKEKLPEFLQKIDKNVSENIIINGWTATDQLSIADVALLTWIASYVFNPFRKDETVQELEKYPTLAQYWDENVELIENYIESERIIALL